MIQCLIAVLTFILPTYWVMAEPTPLEEASRYYQKGENAQDLFERKKAFNQALYFYQEVERNHPPLTHSSRLYQAIANTYFQLQEYPWSILYDYRALEIEPRNPEILNHLAEAQQELNIPSNPNRPWINRWLSFNYFLSLPQRWEIFFWLALFTLAVCLLVKEKRITRLLMIIIGLWALNLLVSFYFTPIEAILVESTGLYREPNLTQAQLLPVPLQAGIKVNVIDTAQEGKWLKIRMEEDNTVGYIPFKTARIINLD